MSSNTDTDPTDTLAAEIFCVTIEPDDAAEPTQSEAASTPKMLAEQRRTKRQRVLKLAQLIIGVSGSTLDCLVIDETRFGVMLETHLTADVPEKVKIRFVGGPTFDALRRWATGNKLGLEFVGVFPDDEASKRQLRAVKNVLKDIGVHAAVHMLREIDFLESAELRAAAEAAETAIARLESVLN